MRLSQISKAIAALGLIIVLVLAGCIVYVLAAPAPALSAPYGDLAIGVSTFSRESFDPIEVSSITYGTIIAPIFEYLLNLDSSGKVTTGITERFEMAPGGLSYTFHIRKGIKFQNGEDLKADDVKFSLERYASKDALLAIIREAQKSVEILDDYTVRVYTDGPQPYYPIFVSNIYGRLGLIMPKDYFEKNGPGYFNLHPVGSGPYKFVKYVAGDSVTYEAVNQHYRQVPAFKNLSILLIPEETTRVAMLKKGQLDIADIEIETSRNIEAAGLRTVVVGENQAGFCFMGAYDPRARTQSLPVADIRVREALNLAINRDEIGKNFFYGKMMPPMPPQMWTTQPDINVPYWRDYCAKVYRYDPVAAKRLLAEAGYPDGFKIKLYTMPEGGAPYLPTLAPIIQGYWQKVGVITEIVNIDLGVFSTMRISGPNKGPVNEMLGQASPRGTRGGPIAVQSASSIYWSKGQWNLLQGGVAEADTLYEASLMEPNVAKRSEMVARLIKISVDTQVHAVIGEVPVLAGLGPNVDIDPTVKQVFGLGVYAEGAKHRKK